MIYSDYIKKEQIADVAAEIIRRYRQDASEQDCIELTEVFLILAKYVDNFFCNEFWAKIGCTDGEFQRL